MPVRRLDVRADGDYGDSCELKSNAADNLLAQLPLGAPMRKGSPNVLTANSRLKTNTKYFAHETPHSPITNDLFLRAFDYQVAVASGNKNDSEVTKR